jgi:hypothetical protein
MQFFANPAGALIRAYQYHYKKRIQAAIVKIEMHASLVDFIGYYPGEGSCFLPKEKVDRYAFVRG